MRKNYNDMILKRIESSFDKLIPISGIVALISSFVLCMSPIPIEYAVIDGLVGIIFLGVYFLRKKMNMETKITITVMLPIGIGFFSFLNGGFSSSLLTLLMISNVVAVLFLSKNKSRFVSVISLIILIGLWLWSLEEFRGELVNIGNAKWVIHILTFTLYLIILHTMVCSIRKYLLENIINLEKSVEKTYKLAYFDMLTGLPNQYMLKNRLSNKVEQGNVEGALIFFSIKNLNLINSLHGEKIGDAVLIEIGNIFNSIKNKKEIIARVAGNEFVLWVEDIEDVEEKIHYFRKEFQVKFSLPYMTQKIEFHISYALYVDNQESIIDSYQKGGIALTFAKTHNRTDVVAYDKTLDDIIRYEESIKEQLAETITSNEFVLFYQTKVDALTGEVVGAEALSRWDNHLLGEISPTVFIPMLENINLAVTFGEIVVIKAMSQYRDLCKKYKKNIKLSINISPSHLIAEGFVMFIENTINDYDIDPELIVLEITENIMIEGMEKVGELIKGLKEIGVKISLDDFGTGFSSLNYLTKMNIDELKIDKSFVDQIGKNEKVDIMLELIVHLSNEYNLNVVAEGVETKEQCEMLVDIGCNIIQGYYFSRPEAL